MNASVVVSIIASVISLISLLVLIINSVLNRKDKSNSDTGNSQYRQGQIDMQLKNIIEKLEKIEAKIDSYDKELDIRIEKALEQHIKEYHKEEN